MIVRAKCQECGVIYIKSKTSHPEVCGNCTCKIPINAGEHPRPETPTIKSGNRYVSKVDWSSDRVRNQVQGRRDHGESLSYIAKCFGVARSTLTMANKRYHLYPPDLRKA